MELLYRFLDFVLKLQMAFIHTPRDHIDIVERRGKYRKMLRPGRHIVVPFIDQLRKRVNMTERVVAFPPQSFTLQDGTVVTINTAIFYQVIRPKDTIYNVNHLLISLRKLVAATLGESLEALDTHQAMSNREEMKTQLRQVLDAAGEHWGIRIISVRLNALNPPEFQAFRC